MHTRLKRLFIGLAGLTLIVPLAAGPAGIASAAPAKQTGATNWTVLVGSEAEKEQTEYGQVGAWQIMKFYPNKITVNAGDTITWKLNSAEIHNVIFPPPGQTYVPFIAPEGNDIVANPLAAFPAGGSSYDGSAVASSGLLGQLSANTPPVKEYKLTFTKPGTYNYICAIHSAQLPNGQVVGMTGSVTVQAAGSALPKTANQVAADAQAEQAADAQAASGADAQAKAVTAPTANSDGTMTYHVNAGFDTQDAAYMRFSPTNFSIHVGDKVEWKQNSAVTPHTITLPSGAKEPDLILAQPQQAGPPRLVLNPQVLAPQGGDAYAGTGFFNSGFINGTDDPAPGPRTYTLTFTKPGTYEYICMLHDMMGMSGHVTVLPAGATPGMPATGAFDGSALPLAAGLAGLALLFSGLWLRRRKAVRI